MLSELISIAMSAIYSYFNSSELGSIKMISTLQGQKVVVVGGTSGMGLGAVQAAIEAGAKVIVASRRPTSVRNALQPLSDKIQHMVVDIMNEGAIRRMFEDIGELDHLFITATPSTSAAVGAFLEQELARAQEFMNGKFFGSWACARYAAAKMRHDGSITFLTGASSIRPRPGTSIITATFAAVEALSCALAVELGPLRVNTIRPGLIDSDMWSFLDAAARNELRENVIKKFPVHRVGKIEDVGHAALFLMTNPYVTGTVLEVTGGEQLVDAF
ncbi:MAG: SDR family oxidoreductase [Acidobacteriota bacterium]